MIIQKSMKSSTLFILFSTLAVIMLAAFLYDYNNPNKLNEFIGKLQKTKSTPTPTYSPQNIKQKKVREYSKKKEKIYSWVDEDGVKRFSNTKPNTNKYVKSFNAIVKSSETKVIINNNSVIVPVTLRHNKRTVSTWLILDTGANVTSIHDDLANQLRISPESFSKFTIADGSIVNSGRKRIDSIKVGSKELYDCNISIIKYKGNSKTQGLLGMDFLKTVDFKIDHDRSVITWL